MEFSGGRLTYMDAKQRGEVRVTGAAQLNVTSLPTQESSSRMVGLTLTFTTPPAEQASSQQGEGKLSGTEGNHTIGGRYHQRAL